MDLPISHELKTDSVLFEATWKGERDWEIRTNDRNYQPDQVLRLRETKYTGNEMADDEKPLIYTGRAMTARVKNILRGPCYGVEDGWCIMSIDVLDRNRRLIRNGEDQVTAVASIAINGQMSLSFICGNRVAEIMDAGGTAGALRGVLEYCCRHDIKEIIVHRGDIRHFTKLLSAHGWRAILNEVDDDNIVTRDGTFTFEELCGQ